MDFNFCPNRGHMLKETEQWTVSGTLDVLLSFCNSCVHKVLGESILMTQCLKCRVKQGIMKISNAGNCTQAADHESPGGC
jgi:hypothetical protein